MLCGNQVRRSSVLERREIQMLSRDIGGGTNLGSVAMAADGNHPASIGKKVRIGSLISRVIAGGDLRGFFRSLKSRNAEALHGSKKGGVCVPEQNMIRASEYLEICQENALDAYKVEDALYWHNEIITELSIELNLLSTTRWPQTVKASMAAALEDRLNQHAAAVTRLAAVLEKNEAFKWEP
jgi:hypothetical protein